MHLNLYNVLLRVDLFLPIGGCINNTCCNLGKEGRRFSDLFVKLEDFVI